MSRPEAVPPGTEGGASAPAQLAKAALGRLALERQEPTPENYARAYQAERGGGPAGASAAADAADGAAWAALFERTVRGLERGSRQWTTARKKDSLQRVLGGSRSDARRLQQRIGQLVASWDNDSPDEPPATDFVVLDEPAPAAPATAPVPLEPVAIEFAAPAEAPAKSPDAAAWPRVAADLGATVQAALPSTEARGREVAEPLAALQARLGPEGPDRPPGLHDSQRRSRRGRGDRGMRGPGEGAGRLRGGRRLERAQGRRARAAPRPAHRRARPGAAAPARDARAGARPRRLLRPELPVARRRQRRRAGAAQRPGDGERARDRRPRPPVDAALGLPEPQPVPPVPQPRGRHRAGPDRGPAEPRARLPAGPRQPGPRAGPRRLPAPAAGRARAAPPAEARGHGRRGRGARAARARLPRRELLRLPPAPGLAGPVRSARREKVHEHSLLEYATKQIAEVPGLKIIGTAKEKTSVLSFVLENIHPHDIGIFLDFEGVAIRTGHHCTQPLMQRYNIPATSRASFAMYNTKEAVDVLVSGLKKIIEVFG